MQAPYYPCYNSWHLIDSWVFTGGYGISTIIYSNMCQASQDSILRMQQSKLNTCTVEGFNRINQSICNTTYYVDNAPYYGLNENCVVEAPAKKKLTIYDLARLIFPDDPIRDYVEKKVAEIEERYRWIDDFY